MLVGYSIISLAPARQSIGSSHVQFSLVGEFVSILVVKYFYALWSELGVTSYSYTTLCNDITFTVMNIILRHMPFVMINM